MSESDIRAQSGVLLALSNVERIRILVLISDRALTAAEIVAETDLDQADVATHLAILGEAGLITTSKDRHERRIQLRLERLDEIASACQERLSNSERNDQATEAIPPGIRQFFRDGRLTSFPAKQSRYLEILGVLVDDFAVDQEYPEAEINQILLRRHEDFATLRRDLVDFGFLTRAHGIYRRVTPRETN